MRWLGGLLVAVGLLALSSPLTDGPSKIEGANASADGTRVEGPSVPADNYATPVVVGMTQAHRVVQRTPVRLTGPAQLPVEHGMPCNCGL